MSFVQGDILATGVADGSFDIVTGSYAVRNAPDLGQVFAEIRRILKPGGSAVLLDFSRPQSRSLQRLQYGLLKGWCGFWGLLLHGNPEIHAYIAASLQTYPDRPTLHALVASRGLRKERARRFYCGMLELLVLHKPVDGA